MLLVSDVYSLLIDALRADKRGLSCEPDEFNRQIRLVNQELFNEYIRDFENNIDNSDDLASLKVHDYNIGLTALASRSLAYGTIPANYFRIIGKPWILDGSTRRFVDLVTEYEDGEREADFLTKASITYPTGRIGGLDGDDLQIKIRPDTITSVYISYLKTIDVPFLDYYIKDTTLVQTYLDETTDAQSIGLGYTYRDGTAGGAAVTVTSLTKNLEWGEGSLSLILSKLIQKVGASLPDEKLIQSAMVDEQKNKD